MQAVISACVLMAIASLAAGAALSQGQLPQETAPTEQVELLRKKRSSYPTAYYAPAPCGSAIPAAAYQINLAHAQHAAAFAPHGPHGYGFGVPQYRDASEEQEVMQFSDMDHMMTQHMPMARYGYGASAAAPLGQILAPASSGATAFGIFPNANTGGCSVPLLLSCSPSIVPGRIMQAHPQASYDEYRGAGLEDHHQHDMHGAMEHATGHEQLSTAHEEHMSMHQ